MTKYSISLPLAIEVESDDVGQALEHARMELIQKIVSDDLEMEVNPV